MFNNTQLSPIQKLSLQYSLSPKPYNFHHRSPPSSVPERKFHLLIQHLRKTIESQLKTRYLSLDEPNTHYWTYISEYLTRKGRELISEKQDNELGRNVSLYGGNQWEIDFVEGERGMGIGEKVELWLGLVVAGKRVREVMELVWWRLGFLFEKKEGERWRLGVEFLEDGEYRVESESVRRYERYLRESGGLERMNSLEEVNTVESPSKEKDTGLQNNSGVKSEDCEFVEYRQRRQTAFDIASNQLMKPMSFTEIKSIKIRKKPSQRLEKKLFENMEQQQDQSQKLFLQKPTSNSNRSHCSTCSSPFTFLSSSNYCHYSGSWFCNQCISPQKAQIPYKILSSFDLRPYSVSSKAFTLLQSISHKPLLTIDIKTHPTKNAKLLSFLLLKKQLHLLYDIICDRKLVESQLESSLHYLLKPDIFSINNLLNIQFNNEQARIKRVYNMLFQHFMECEKCQRKGFQCKKCENKRVIFTFQIKSVKGCKGCKGLYHNECIQKGCQCQQV